MIDDEPLIGITLRILLEDCDVSVSTSGRQARELLRTTDYDVILCDLALSDVSGIQLAEWLDRDRPQLAARLIFMTGGAFTDEAQRFLSALPRERILEKPFSPEEIHSAMRSIGRPLPKD